VGRSRGQLYDKHIQLSDLARQSSRYDASRVRYESGYSGLGDLAAIQRKHLLETEAQRARGVVRFEANLRSDLLVRNGLKVVSDLDEGVLARVIENMFRKLRLDTQIGGRARVDALMIRLAETKDPNYKYFDQVVGRQDAERLGLPPCKTSSDAKARDRGLAAEWGISAADLTRNAGSASYLDWYTATLRHVPD